MRPKDRVYKNHKYERFIASKPCLICGQVPIEKHHVYHARKNCFLLLPLCTAHHMPGFKDSYHTLEHNRFEDAHSIILKDEIINLLSEFINEEHVE